MSITNSYEAVFVYSVKSGDENTKALAEKFKALIEGAGTLKNVAEWGKRRLAYPINDEFEGFYILYNFAAQADFPAELERVAGITDGVLRTLVVRKDENKKTAPKAPEAVIATPVAQQPVVAETATEAPAEEISAEGAAEAPAEEIIEAVEEVKAADAE
jgi:small subunit ribosomal protein S6